MQTTWAESHGAKAALGGKLGCSVFEYCDMLLSSVPSCHERTGSYGVAKSNLPARTRASE